MISVKIFLSLPTFGKIHFCTLYLIIQRTRVRYELLDSGRGAEIVLLNTNAG